MSSAYDTNSKLPGKKFLNGLLKLNTKICKEKEMLGLESIQEEPCKKNLLNINLLTNKQK